MFKVVIKEGFIIHRLVKRVLKILAREDQNQAKLSRQKEENCAAQSLSPLSLELHVYLKVFDLFARLRI